jgi:hypothetical protein
MMSVRQQCFISAPAGTDLKTLRQVLTELNVEWIDASVLNPRIPVSNAVREAMQHASFVCGVLTQQHDNTNVVFELGMSTALNRPTFLLMEPSVKIAHRLEYLPYARVELNDPAKLRFHLQTFLKHVLTIKVLPVTPPSEPALKPEPESLARALKASYTANAADLEHLVAMLFEASGAVVSASDNPDRGVDLALWIDSLPSSIGNPVLVEVKSGRLSQAQLDEAESTLRNYLVSAGANVGILLYRDTRGTRFPQTREAWPLVWRLDFDGLVDLLTRGAFERELVRFRNVALHG